MFRMQPFLIFMLKNKKAGSKPRSIMQNEILHIS